MKFVIKKDKFITVGEDVKSYKAGEYETENEHEVKALKGAQDVTYDGAEEEAKLFLLRSEYESLSGKKAHHASGVDKLKSDIDALKNKNA